MLTKRQKISISSLLLAAGLFFIPLVDPSNKPPFIIAITVASYFLSLWSIYGSFSIIEFATLFSLPAILTASFALFLSQFEVSTTTKSLLIVTYIVVMYTILLSENIFTVSVERNIPLVRAARTVGYLATLFVSFAFFSLLFGLGTPFYLFSAVSFVIGTLLFAQGLWQIELKDTNLSRLISFSVVGGLILGEVALALSFWPLDPPRMGLATAATVYVVLGLLQHYIREDLSKRTIFEYLFVAAAVVFLLIVTTSWGA